MSEEIPCKNGHVWNGTTPGVVREKHYIQHPELTGKPCDCGRVVFTEQMCGCPTNRHWEMKYIENLNYGKS